MPARRGRRQMRRTRRNLAGQLLRYTFATNITNNGVTQITRSQVGEIQNRPARIVRALFTYVVAFTSSATIRAPVLQFRLVSPNNETVAQSPLCVATQYPRIYVLRSPRNTDYGTYESGTQSGSVMCAISSSNILEASGATAPIVTITCHMWISYRDQAGSVVGSIVSGIFDPADDDDGEYSVSVLSTPSAPE